MTIHTDRRYVEIVNLTKAYPNPYGEPVKVVEDFNLILRRGEIVSVIGHSGCGKSTVLTMVAGLNDATAGSLVVAGGAVSPSRTRGRVAPADRRRPWDA